MSQSFNTIYCIYYFVFNYLLYYSLLVSSRIFNPLR
uniref:Uncharacterized protein n=1 Tax=Siphoviridae sp. ct1IF5 TaxID=2827765 RepID=A0A8S5TF83_9CAUD|nr:MAG TPA: hypothetical protein [Siphoviridae sp. ct1IF5]